MTSNKSSRPGYRQGVIALALAAAFGPAFAEGEDLAKFIKPESSVTAGLGGVSGNKQDRAFFGQYNGFRKDSGQLLFDVDLNKRDDASGTWTNFDARNLGSENREMRFSQQKQSDWKYFFEYGELVRNYSNTINTNIGGIGTNNLVVNTLGNPTATPTAAGLAAAQGTGSNVDLKTTRKSLGFGADKWLTANLQFEASFKNEDKTGARLYGQSVPCSAGRYGCTGTRGYMLLLPEPINSSTRQFEMKLNYADEKLTLNGGYYGSFFVNKFGALNTVVATPSNMWNPNGSRFGVADTAALTTLMQLPLALPPDNQAHQISLAGTYAITPTTRATFKYAYTHATQKESFDSMGLVGGPRGALDAVVDTTVAQAGITARPLPKLSLVANLRWEQKSDKTPIDKYRTTVTTTVPVGLTNTNNPGSHTKVKGKLEASYQLPAGYRATAGLDYDFRDLGRPTGTNDTSGQASAIRAKNDELGYRFEVRKSLAENLNGVVSVGHSKRNGSRWMTATNGTAPTTPDGTLQGAGFNLFPLFWMDLERDKVKGSVDWAATNDLNFQASVESAAEHYYAPTMRGARDGKSTGLNLDASYKISDNWKMNGWYSRGDTILDVNGTTGAYMAGLRQLGHNLGIGVRGAPTGQLEVGADFTFSYEVNRTATGVIGRSTQPNALPAAAFRQLNLNIFGKHALDKTADIRVNLVHQRYYSNEWFWNNNGTPFFYTDGTTVTQKDQQNVTFIGATYIYKFQ
jgi:MtrB/PioB family decaheme-associated outer membrane protein